MKLSTFIPQVNNDHPNPHSKQHLSRPALQSHGISTYVEGLSNPDNIKGHPRLKELKFDNRYRVSGANHEALRQLLIVGTGIWKT